MKNSITVLNHGELPAQFDKSELPSIITGQINKLNDLNSKVKSAIEQANAAEAAADYARRKPTGLFEKKDAIETIQSALAESDKRFAEELKMQAETDRQHNEFLISLAKNEEENAKVLIELKNEYSSSLAVISKKLIVSYAIAGVGVLLGVAALLLTLQK